jgi:Mrp family chromosome partitioning ATPase
LDKVGSGLGQQLRTRLSLGRGTGADPYEEIFELLLSSDCGVRVAEEMVEGLRERAARQKLREAAPLLDALREEMAARLAGFNRELSLTGEPSVWLVAGVNGAGKTTTVAKLAARLQGQGMTPLIAAADTFRAAAIDQLRALAAKTGTEVVAHQLGSDPAAVVFDAVAAAKARGREVVLVDTAGRLHTKHNLMQELGKIRRVLTSQQEGQPVETLLVLDAYVGATMSGLTRSARRGPSEKLSALPGWCSPNWMAAPAADTSSRSNGSSRCQSSWLGWVRGLTIWPTSIRPPIWTPCSRTVGQPARPGEPIYPITVEPEGSMV